MRIFWLLHLTSARTISGQNSIKIQKYSQAALQEHVLSLFGSAQDLQVCAQKLGLLKAPAYINELASAAQIRELLKMPMVTKTRASLTGPAGVKRPAPAASVQPGAG